jgi:poly(A) polymerase
MLKLLQTGHALASIAQLRSLGLAKGIYPLLDVVVERGDDPFVQAALQDTDRRVGEGKPVAPSFLLACVLWSDVRQAWDQRRGKVPPFPALQEAIDEVFDARIGDVSGRGKLGANDPGHAGAFPCGVRLHALACRHWRGRGRFG